MAAEHPTILVVDDEPAIQEFIAAVLGRQGYRVLKARHADHALELCKEHPDPIHLLLTDVVMPQMNGRELATHALAIRPQMRVLYISGNEAGILHEDDKVALLEKPFSPGALLEKVRDTLGDAD